MPRPSKKVLEETIHSNIDEQVIETQCNNVVEAPIKKKRGRKSKKELLELQKQGITLKPTNDKENTVPKKRGRKPKGGKIITNISVNNENNEVKSNIILHLKCSSKDIQDNQTFISNINYNPNIESIEAFNNNDDQFYTIENNNEYNDNSSIIIEQGNNNDNCCQNKNNTCNNNNNDVSIKQLWIKLKELQYKLHNNNVTDKKSDCFWCTYKFDNLPIYIPKYEINGNYEVYGCFCSPECACAYLCNENIDNSTRWERYSLLNSLYSSVYNYDKNIKPAPNPHYILDKYYGNMTIEEYRKLNQTNRLLMVVNKPLTRVLPEVFDENDEYPSFTSTLNSKNDKDNNLNKKSYRLMRNKPPPSQNNKDTNWNIKA